MIWLAVGTAVVMGLSLFGIQYFVNTKILAISARMKRLEGFYGGEIGAWYGVYQNQAGIVQNPQANVDDRGRIAIPLSVTFDDQRLAADPYTASSYVRGSPLNEPATRAIDSGTEEIHRYNPIAFNIRYSPPRDLSSTDTTKVFPGYMFFTKPADSFQVRLLAVSGGGGGGCTNCSFVIPDVCSWAHTRTPPWDPATTCSDYGALEKCIKDRCQQCEKDGGTCKVEDKPCSFPCDGGGTCYPAKYYTWDGCPGGGGSGGGGGGGSDCPLFHTRDSNGNCVCMPEYTWTDDGTPTCGDCSMNCTANPGGTACMRCCEDLPTMPACAGACQESCCPTGCNGNPATSCKDGAGNDLLNQIRFKNTWGGAGCCSDGNVDKIFDCTDVLPGTCGAQSGFGVCIDYSLVSPGYSKGKQFFACCQTPSICQPPVTVPLGNSMCPFPQTLDPSLLCSDKPGCETQKPNQPLQAGCAPSYAGNIQCLKESCLAAGYTSFTDTPMNQFAPCTKPGGGHDCSQIHNISCSGCVPEAGVINPGDYPWTHPQRVPPWDKNISCNDYQALDTYMWNACRDCKLSGGNCTMTPPAPEPIDYTSPYPPVAYYFSANCFPSSAQDQAPCAGVEKFPCKGGARGNVSMCYPARQYAWSNCQTKVFSCDMPWYVSANQRSVAFSPCGLTAADVSCDGFPDAFHQRLCEIAAGCFASTSTGGFAGNGFHPIKLQCSDYRRKLHALTVGFSCSIVNPSTLSTEVRAAIASTSNPCTALRNLCDLKLNCNPNDVAVECEAEVGRQYGLPANWCQGSVTMNVEYSCSQCYGYHNSNGPNCCFTNSCPSPYVPMDPPGINCPPPCTGRNCY